MRPLLWVGICTQSIDLAGVRSDLCATDRLGASLGGGGRTHGLCLGLLWLIDPAISFLRYAIRLNSSGATEIPRQRYRWSIYPGLILRIMPNLRCGTVGRRSLQMRALSPTTSHPGATACRRVPLA